MSGFFTGVLVTLAAEAIIFWVCVKKGWLYGEYTDLDFDPPRTFRFGSPKDGWDEAKVFVPMPKMPESKQ